MSVRVERLDAVEVGVISPVPCVFVVVEGDADLSVILCCPISSSVFAASSSDCSSSLAASRSIWIITGAGGAK